MLLVRTERQNSQKQKNSRKKAKRTKAKWNQHPADLIYDGKQMRMGREGERPNLDRKTNVKLTSLGPDPSFRWVTGFCCCCVKFLSLDGDVEQINQE